MMGRTLIIVHGSEEAIKGEEKYGIELRIHWSDNLSGADSRGVDWLRGRRRMAKGRRRAQPAYG